MSRHAGIKVVLVFRARAKIILDYFVGKSGSWKLNRMWD